MDIRYQLHSEPTLSIIKKQKSLRTAILLASLFGPIGLLYASSAGGSIMVLIGGMFIIIKAMPVVIMFYWMLCVILSLYGVRYNNQKQPKKIYIKYRFKKLKVSN
jgi:hypothetical protein